MIKWLLNILDKFFPNEVSEWIDSMDCYISKDEAYEYVASNYDPYL
jgi:hypothetical protein